MPNLCENIKVYYLVISRSFLFLDVELFAHILFKVLDITCFLSMVNTTSVTRFRKCEQLIKLVVQYTSSWYDYHVESKTLLL